MQRVVRAASHGDAAAIDGGLHDLIKMRKAQRPRRLQAIELNLASHCCQSDQRPRPVTVSKSKMTWCEARTSSSVSTSGSAVPLRERIGRTSAHALRVVRCTATTAIES